MFKYGKNTRLFFSTAQLFLSSALIFGTWVVYIPTVVNKLNISEGELGITFLIGSLGSLIGTIAGKILNPKFGEGKLAQVSISVVALSAIGLLLATNYIQLVISFFFFGFFGGIFQVSVNTLVITIEKLKSISIMSSCHAFFSMGAMIAAGIGSFLVGLFNNPVLHISIAAILVILLQLLSSGWVFNIQTEQVKNSLTKSSKNSKLITLSAIAFIGIAGMISEGAIADWSGLFLIKVANTPLTLQGLGYAGFSLAMTIGRFTGDFFSKRFGSIPLIIAGFCISLSGFGVVLAGLSHISIIGFIIIGAGLSIVVPEAYRLAATIKGISPETGIAFIAGAAYIGFLGGPVALGFIAEHFNLWVSFATLSGLIVMGTIIAVALQHSPKAQKSNQLKIETT